MDAELWDATADPCLILERVAQKRQTAAGDARFLPDLAEQVVQPSKGSCSKLLDSNDLLNTPG